MSASRVCTTGVVGDFVVAGIQRVHSRGAADDIQDCEIRANIPQKDVHCGPQERVAIVQPVQTGMDILAPLLPALPELQENIAKDQHQRTCKEIGIAHQQNISLGASSYFRRAREDFREGQDRAWRRRR